MKAKKIEYPKKIKVGCRTFKVKVRNPIADIRSNSFGEFDLAKGQIRLALSLDRNKAGHTMLHEVLHAVFSMWEIGEAKELTEEHCIAGLSSGLAAVMLDNPGLMEWIEANLRESKK